jgi:amidase
MTVDDDLATLDATASADLVRSEAVSPTELVDAAIARIEALNPTLDAVIHERFDRARAEAAGDLPDGPFRGVPFLLKDFSCRMAGEPLHEGMAFLKRIGWIEGHDSWLAEQWRRAGLVVLGRTNTPEVGILPTTEPAAYGPTRNPWATDRTPGGSSGGSAAAVASGMVPAAHGNDGGGSIRIPASACGLVGLKPTRGRVSLAPDYGDLLGGLVVDGALTRSVRDTAALLDVAEGAAPGEPFVLARPERPYVEEVGADPGSLRIGVMTDAPGGAVEVHAECVEAARGTASLLESLGHHVEVSHPAALDDPEYTGHFVTTWAAGMAWVLDYWTRLTGHEIGPDDVEPLTWALAEMGRSCTAPQWLTSREWLQVSTRAIARWWADGFDLLLTPTLAEPPPPLGSFDSPPDEPLHGILRAATMIPFTPAFNVTGQPAVSLPLHTSADGLPIGVQLVAAAGREDVLVRVAAQLEAAAPWADRRPPVHA